MGRQSRPAGHRVIWPLLAILATVPGLAHAQAPTSDSAVKAAMLYNFTKFIEWPARTPAGPLTLCVIGQTTIADALAQAVRSKSTDGRPLDVIAIGSDKPLGMCDVVFVDASETQRAAPALRILRTRPVLTVSDSKDFARTDGISEFFAEGGRLRFVINTDAAGRAGLQISSRLLGLAKIVTDHGAR